MLIVFQFQDVPPSASNNFTGLTMKARVIPDPFSVRREYVPDPSKQVAALAKLLTAHTTKGASHE